MANIREALAQIMQIDGAHGACIVDSDTGMVLGATGGGPVNLELAAAGNTEVVRSKRKTMKVLGLGSRIEDMLITLTDQYHLIRPLVSNDALFVYLVLDKKRGNLGMARLQLANAEKTLAI
jgi:predicted regulator of Ras-like GTPase activity (Roadblock/LC7/MglB family)